MADKINGLIQERLCSELDSGVSGGPVGFGAKEPYAYASALFYFQSESGFYQPVLSIISSILPSKPVGYTKKKRPRIL